MEPGWRHGQHVTTMMSFLDVPDANIEHVKRMELRCIQSKTTTAVQQGTCTSISNKVIVTVLEYNI